MVATLSTMPWDTPTTTANERLADCAQLLQRMVRRLMPARLRSKIDPEDVVQSAWLAICRRQPDVDVFALNETLHRYLRTVTRHCLIDLIRHFRRASACECALEGDEGLCTAEPAPEQWAVAEELWNCLLKTCPPTHRPILVLKRQGASLAEIAEATGLHESSVRRILYRLAPPHLLASAPDEG